LSLPFTGREDLTNLGAGAVGAGGSGNLDSLWARLKDNPKPHVLDCGPIQSPTVAVLAKRGCRLYVGDLLSLACHAEGELWDRTGKVPVFRTARLLSELPPIPPGSLSVVFCWHILDLLPRGALPDVVGRMFLYLQPGGALFFFLREPHFRKVADTAWYLETPTRVATRGSGQKPFPYPPVSNREMHWLIPAGIAKIVQTRSGVREVLVVK
jgi:hypothetical protein